MKQLPLVCLIVCLVSALIFAALSARAQDAIAPPQPRVAAEPFVWRFAPPVGSRWTMRWFTRTATIVETPSIHVEFDGKTQESQSGPGQPFVTNSTHIQRFTADYDVISRDALGATTIRLIYREMDDDMKSGTAGKRQRPDSSPRANSKAIDGATLTFKQAPDGTIWSVLGARALQRRIWELDGDVSAADLKRLSRADKSLLNADWIKLVDSWMGTLPVSPLRVGESWSSAMNLSDPLPRPIRLNGARTLKSLTPASALVTDSAIVDAEKLKGQIPVVPGQGQLQVGYDQISGSTAGSARVERASGLPLERQIDRKFKGVISMPLGDGEGHIIYVSTVYADIQTSTRIVLAPR